MVNENITSRRGFLKTALSAWLTTLISWTKTDAKEVLNNEKIEKILSKIKWVLFLHIMKWKNGLWTLEDTSLKISNLLKKIIQILQEEWISFTRTWNDQLDIMNFFSSIWYSFVISPIEIFPWKFAINSPIFKKRWSKQFDLSSIEIWDLDTSNSKVTIYDAEKILPDIREIVDFWNWKTLFDWITISNTLNWEKEVLIFPDDLKKTWFTRKMVELNEVSQVYFWEFIPPKLLGVKLVDIWIPMPEQLKDTKLFHVQEAFSDLVSLKYWDDFDREFNRILTSRWNYSYKLSVEIARLSLLNFLSAFPWLKFDWSNYKEIRSKLNDKDYQELIEVVIWSYEANIWVLNLNTLKRNK